MYSIFSDWLHLRAQTGIIDQNQHFYLSLGSFPFIAYIPSLSPPIFLAQCHPGLNPAYILGLLPA